LLAAGPTRASAKAPFLFADFCIDHSVRNRKESTVAGDVQRQQYQQLTLTSSSMRGPCMSIPRYKSVTQEYCDEIPYAIDAVTRLTSWSIFTKVSCLSSPALTWPFSMQKAAS